MHMCHCITKSKYVTAVAMGTLKPAMCTKLNNVSKLNNGWLNFFSWQRFKSGRWQVKGLAVWFCKTIFFKSCVVMTARHIAMALAQVKLYHQEKVEFKADFSQNYNGVKVTNGGHPTSLAF